MVVGTLASIFSSVSCVRKQTLIYRSEYRGGPGLGEESQPQSTVLYWVHSSLVYAMVFGPALCC
jgi:hypothetical protein